MNSNTVNAFMNLKKSQKARVQSELGIYLSQGVSETGTQYTKRVLRQIENEGKMRELEEAIASIC